MADNKKSFLLYCDIIHTVNKLSDEKAGELFKHILKYVNDEHPTTDDFMIELVFEPIKQALKRDLLKYENIVNRNRNNGLSGGRPKKEPKEPNGFINNPNNPVEPKKADIDIDSDIDSDIDIVIDSDILLKKVTKRFLTPTVFEINNYCLERNNKIDAESFFDFYESKGWMVGKNKMKDWKAAVRQWEKSNINKNIQNGNTEQKIGRQSISTIQANANPDKWFKSKSD